MPTPFSRRQAARSPSSTREEVVAKEAAEKRQEMLNEEWPSYAARKGLQQDALHVKNATETWMSFETRRKKQKMFFELQGRIVTNEIVHTNAAKHSQRAQSNSLVEKLLAFDRQRLNKQTPPQHYLFVDFCEYQQLLFSQQRAALIEFESVVRSKLYEGETELLFSIVYMWHADSQLQHVYQRERAHEERLMRQHQKLMELEKAAEERHLEAERIAREQQRVEDERERAEVEKRLERKRREDERRAKARLEREQQVIKDGPSENQS